MKILPYKNDVRIQNNIFLIELATNTKQKNLKLIIRVVSIISLSEVVALIFFVLCLLLVQLNYYLFWIRKSFL